MPIVYATRDYAVTALFVLTTLKIFVTSMAIVYATRDYAVTALILVNIVPSLDVKGRALALYILRHFQLLVATK